MEPHSRRPLWYAVAAAVIVLGAVSAFLVTRPDLPVTPIALYRANEPVPIPTFRGIYQKFPNPVYVAYVSVPPLMGGAQSDERALFLLANDRTAWSRLGWRLPVDGRYLMFNTFVMFISRPSGYPIPARLRVQGLSFRCLIVSKSEFAKHVAEVSRCSP